MVGDGGERLEVERLVEVLARTAALAIERDRADHALRDHAIRQRFLADIDAATRTAIRAGPRPGSKSASWQTIWKAKKYSTHRPVGAAASRRAGSAA